MANDVNQTPAAPPAPAEGAAPAAMLKQAPVADKNATWAKVDAVFNAAKMAYLGGKSTLTNVLDSLAATLTDMSAAEQQGMGGLGAGQPEMELPAPPAPAAGEEAPVA